jgi:hypothetical protein
MNFYRAAARSGLVLSSSVALAVHRPYEDRLWLASGRHRIGPMLELPVLSYACPVDRHDRLRALSPAIREGTEVVGWIIFRNGSDR